MRVSLNWLGEFVDLPEDASLEHLHAALVKVGFEEEDEHTFDLSGPIVVGQVLEFVDEPQSNGKTIRWCQVDVGPSTGSGNDVRGIVCGANNFFVGDKVVVSLPGAILPGPFPISARNTYGHVSDGMIASAKELGLGEEHAGILRLAELGLDPEVGVDAVSLLGLDDAAVEINVTPDRGYAFSIRGVAREYSHSTGAAFRDPALRKELLDLVATPVSGFEVTIDDSNPIRGKKGVIAFVARAVRGVDPTRPSPPWMVARLTLAGIRSISLAVDITNYVMLELGQPIHAYDLDKLKGGFTIRRAKAGEKFETLDGQVRTLDPEDLLIDDESGPVGLAGVMGGALTEISSTTTNVLVEAGTWEPVTIARTARRHKLWSEAARRYERGVDPVVAAAAAARVVELLVELGGGTPDPLGTVLSEFEPRTPITLPDGFVSSLIGVHYSADEITDTLTALGATIETSDNGLAVTPPTWRPDLTDKATLVEEVARIIGYDRIPSELPTAPPGRGWTREQRLRKAAANSLASAGLTEVLTYPFLPKSTIDAFGSPTAESVSAIKLANPLDAEAAWMRTTLLPGLIEIARRNLSRGLTDLALFELGMVFRPVEGAKYGSGPLPVGDARPSADKLAELDASIPPQPWHVAGFFVGDSVPKQPGHAAVPTGLGDALDATRQLAASVGLRLDAQTGNHKSLHPGRTAELFVDGRSVGFAGELLPSIALDRDLPRTVAVFELDFDVLTELADRDVEPGLIAGFPAATQDLSLVVEDTVPAGELLATVIEGAGALLEDARLVDDYRGTGLADGTKSLTFALRFRAPDRTLTAAEATESKNAAVALAATRHEATLRE